MTTNEELRERVAAAGFQSRNNETPWAKLNGPQQRLWRHLADAVLAELAPELDHVPPDGLEAVHLPPDVVDWYAARHPVIKGGNLAPVVDAARATQARRPKPEPETERVPWWEAKDRIAADDGLPIIAVGQGTTGTWYRTRSAPWPSRFVDPPHTVEVLKDPS